MLTGLHGSDEASILESDCTCRQDTYHSLRTYKTRAAYRLEYIVQKPGHVPSWDECISFRDGCHHVKYDRNVHGERGDDRDHEKDDDDKIYDA